MATIRGVLRASAQRLVAPSDVLRWVNDQVCPNMPPNMFATCLYAVVEPTSGRIRFANAGHNLPYRRSSDGVNELRATGMPLGLMEGMEYEEQTASLGPGESLLFYSDGLVEAHNGDRQMFGFPRLGELVGRLPAGTSVIDSLMAELHSFTGPGWEQEDDVTLVALHREGEGEHAGRPKAREVAGRGGAWRVLAAFELPSERGKEREAMDRVVSAVDGLGLSTPLLERLKTAVSESTMNAMEHGNQYRPELPVAIELRASDEAIAVRVTDQGRGDQIPAAEEPDLEAKLVGEQSPRGWGLFLIKNLVDEVRVSGDEGHHSIELILRREGGSGDSQPV